MTRASRSFRQLLLSRRLATRVRHRESRRWSLNRRMFSGPDWTRFQDRASRVRVLIENTVGLETRSTLFLAIAALRDPILLTPNLRKLKWQTSHTFSELGSAINMFIGPSLESLEIYAKLLVNHVIGTPLGVTCLRLRHLKITGNARSAAGTISSVLRGLHCSETVACSTLDNDAVVHLAQLKSISYLAVDMRWSVVDLNALCHRLCPDSFLNVQTLHWKDYDLDSLTDMFLVPAVSLSNVHLEIESFCTSSSLRTFLRTFTAKFPHTRVFSLVHDVEAGRRFGLQVGVPGREHQLDVGDVKPLLTLTSLRELSPVDLGRLRLDDELVEAIASALPDLEQLRLGATTLTPSSVTFDGLLFLLQHCSRLACVGLSIDVEDVLSIRDTPVRHERVTHLRLEGRDLGLRRREVDAMLKRVFPRLMTIEESLDGMIWRVRDVHTVVTRHR